MSYRLTIKESTVKRIAKATDVGLIRSIDAELNKILDRLEKAEGMAK